MKFTFPAVFSDIREEKGWVQVLFPDLVPNVTEGESISDAILMAKDFLLSVMPFNNNHQAKPSNIDDLMIEYPNSLVMNITVEFDE